MRKWVLIILNTFLIIACDKEDTPSPPDPSEGTLEFIFKGYNDGNSFQMYQDIYRDTLLYRVEGLKFYIDEVQLDQERSNDIGLVDFTENHINSHSNGESIKFQIKHGTYSKLSFVLGIDSLSNHSNPSDYPEDHPLSSFHDTHWTWAQGYKFVMFDGKFDKNGDGQITESFTYHIGNQPYLRHLEFKLPIDIHENQTTQITFSFHVDRILEGIDLNTESFTHSTNNLPLVERLADNCKNAIELHQSN